MNINDRILVALAEQEPDFFYIEGTGDIYFGRNFTGVFLPFENEIEPSQGLYYIAGQDTFYVRVASKAVPITRLLNAATDQKYRQQLMPTVIEVLELKSAVKYKKVALPKQVKTKEIQPAARPLLPNRHYLILRGSSTPTGFSQAL